MRPQRLFASSCQLLGPHFELTGLRLDEQTKFEPYYIVNCSEGAEPRSEVANSGSAAVPPASCRDLVVKRRAAVSDVAGVKTSVSRCRSLYYRHRRGAHCCSGRMGSSRNW